MGILPLCLAAPCFDHTAAQKGHQRRISDLECRIRPVWTYFRQSVCNCLSPCRSRLCTGLLDQRAAMGCLAWRVQLRADAGDRKAAVFAA